MRFYCGKKFYCNLTESFKNNVIQKNSTENRKSNISHHNIITIEMNET